MYFPGDPLFAYDPIFNSVPDPAARERMVARFSIDRSVDHFSLGFEFDVSPARSRRDSVRGGPLSSGMTPSQTVGPYFSIGLPWERGALVVAPDTPGAITIAMAVFDGRGEPVIDSMIETWQADPDGRFADLHGHAGPSQLPGFRGFARCAAEQGDGRFEIVTVKPGRVSWPDGGEQAPHIDVSVFARGMLHRCVTRVYFADEPDANANDPLLQSVPAARRTTLLAEPAENGYAFDIHLQGPDETVFFSL